MSHARTSDPVEHQAAPAEGTGAEVARSTGAGEVSQGTSAGPRPHFIDHVTPVKRDLTYDPGRARATLPVEVHFRDGSTATAALVLNPDQMTVVSLQLERAIDKRNRIGTAR
ncbi:hypothetical protein CTZ27_31375 [Streptomyces griseocarneus]|nr:hypothetical protein CTZ27_31375 [Streptomyces griseocarneus]